VSARIGEAFGRASRENRAAFVAYLTAGDPDPGTTVELARAADAGGADVLELGVPFSDPIADGATLQRAAARALAAGTTVEGVFSIAARIRQATDLPLVLFSYANPLLARGRNALGEAKNAGFDGVLLTDVPVEEADAFLPAIREADLDSIFLVSPTSTASRMRAAAARSRGFLYVVSRNGTTGEKAKLAADLGATVLRARRAVSAQDAGSARRLPIAVGFGIATPEDAAAVAAVADGVVVGSALVACAERGGRHAARDLERLVRALSGACAR
jgi:tryptophan synthase alpha chain